MKVKYFVLAAIAGTAVLFYFLKSNKHGGGKKQESRFNHKNARGEKHIRAVMNKAGSTQS